MAVAVRTMRSRDPELQEARRRLDEVKREAVEVIKIMTAEQAIRAQRVVREAGRIYR